MNSSSVSRKKYDEGNSTLTPCQQLRNQNTSVGVGLIEFTEPSDILNFNNIAVLYPEKGMMGVVPLQPDVSNYKFKMRQ